MVHTEATDPQNEGLNENRENKNIESTVNSENSAEISESNLTSPVADPVDKDMSVQDVQGETSADTSEPSDENVLPDELILKQETEDDSGPVSDDDRAEVIEDELSKNEGSDGEEASLDVDEPVREEETPALEKETDTEDTDDDDSAAMGSDEDENKEVILKKKSVKVVDEVEKVDYKLLSREDLVKVFEEQLGSVPFEKSKHLLEDISMIFNEKTEQELTDKKEKFVEEGGLEQDFKPIEDPVSKQMNDLLEKLKSIKADYNKQLEEMKEVNLATKQEILEEFRLLMEGQEGFDNTFRKFKQLQTRWFEVGIVPKQNLKDLWNSYNYFVDKFNDYVKINRELRVLDLKKNLDMKIDLCIKAEKLVEDSNVSNAFKALQKLHTRWREIGPVPREDKDVVWERFKNATSKVNKAHQNFQIELKDSLVENLELKKALCEKVESIAESGASNHKEWAEKTKVLLDLQKEWKGIGYAPKKENNMIYARFRKACDDFFEQKAAFYAETFEHQQKNVQMKNDIVKAAEEIKDSTDWKRTTDKLIELQKKWKEIGPVPRKESDRLWKKFRTACDHFFQNKSDFFGGKNESYEDNLKAKEEIIAEMKAFKAGDNSTQSLSVIEQFQERFNEIGFVPVEEKDRIRDEFREAQDKIISLLDLEDSDIQLLRFKMKLAGYSGNPKAENKLHFEREKLMTKLLQLKNDIGVWENNIGFFKQTKSSEDTLADFNEKIVDARNRIDLLEKKINLIDDWEEEL